MEGRNNVAAAIPNQPREIVIDAPTYIKELPTYDGTPEFLSTFIDSIDEIQPLLTTYNRASQLTLINRIRGKLRGQAKLICDTNAHLTSWEDTKRLLIKNFCNNKTHNQLYEELRHTPYKGDIVDFYFEIHRRADALNRKCTQLERAEEIPMNMNIALSIFIEKLPRDLRIGLNAHNPPTLTDALVFLEQANLLTPEEKTSQNHSQKNSNPQKHDQRYNDNLNRNPNNRNYYQNYQNNHYPQRQNNNYQQRSFQNFLRPQYHNNYQQNFQQKPQYNNYQPRQNFNQQQNRQSRPEPMEVDGSGQTRRNYLSEQIDETRAENFPLPASHTNYHM